MTNLLHDGYSHSSRRAYSADWEIFSTYCDQTGNSSLPAKPNVVAEFVDLDGIKRKPATIARRLAAIASIHRDHDHPDPTKARDVRVALKRLYRKKGRRQGQALAINSDTRFNMLSAASATLRERRDRALLSVAYDTGCRRSELVSILIEDIDRADDGSGTVLLRKTKTDQEGAGHVRYLAPDTLTFIDAWLDAARIETGFLFRAVAGRVVRQLMPDASVSKAFKRMARRAGMDASIAMQFSGHSTRVGMAQDMAAGGIDLVAIMQAGGWKSPVMVARYVERLNARQGAAAKLAKMHGRVGKFP
jgi:integrase